MNHGSQHGSSNNLRLPPFGKILLAYQEQRVRLDFTIYIHVGNGADEQCYAEIKSGSLASFLPYGESFFSYRWPVFNQHVVLIDHGGPSETELHKMCFTLLKYHPRLIYLWSEKHPNQFFKGATQ